MNRIFRTAIVICMALAVLVAGCSTAKRATYATLAGVVTLEDTAMKAWASYVVDEMEAIAELKVHALDDPQKRSDILARENALTRGMGKVSIAHGKYQSVILPALTSASAAGQAKELTEAGPSALEAAHAVAALIATLKTH